VTSKSIKSNPESGIHRYGTVAIFDDVRRHLHALLISHVLQIYFK